MNAILAILCSKSVVIDMVDSCDMFVQKSVVCDIVDSWMWTQFWQFCIGKV